MWERDTDLTPGTKARPSKEHIKGTPASLEDYTEDIHNLEERDDFLTRTSGQCHKQHPLIVLHGNYNLAQDTRTLVNHQGKQTPRRKMDRSLARHPTKEC